MFKQLILKPSLLQSHRPLSPARGLQTWTSATCCTVSRCTAALHLQGAAPTPTSPPLDRLKQRSQT